MFHNLFNLIFTNDWGKYVEEVSADDFMKYHYPWI
jgi:hypothetical protein